MTLSADQLTAIKHGEAVRVREDGLECVVLLADVYEQSCAKPYDNSDWSEEEMAQLAERMFDDLDSAGGNPDPPTPPTNPITRRDDPRSRRPAHPHHRCQ